MAKRRIPRGGKRCPKCEGRGVLHDPAVIGREMKALREKAGVTLRQLGPIVDLNYSLIWQMEQGRAPWSDERIDRIRRALEYLGDAA